MTVSQKYPTSIISIDKTFNKKFHHPSQKPVELLRYLIRTYTNTGDTVLDNAMGSGSTIIACIDEQRRYIGIEKDPHFFQLAKQRIQEHKLNNK